MAKSPKGKTEESKIEESEIDAVEVSEDAVEDVVDVENDVFDDEPEDVVADDFDMEIVEDEVEDPVVEAMPDPVGQEPVVPEPAQSNAFVPTVVGGLIAGAIGYGVATFFPLGTGSSDLDTQLAAQADQIAELEAQIAAIPVPDLSSLETQISETTAQSAEQIASLESSVGGQIDTLEARILEIEKTPNVDGTLSETALAAYQAELDQLRSEMAVQQESVMISAAQAEADLAAAREEAARLEQEAIATAQAASNRAALNRIATAVETGAPFADALAGLEGGEVPAALSDAADTGVTTTAQLVQDFPAAARAALATARAEGVSDDAGGLGGFLRSQFDVRSTAPQEGAGPDAVLSRAEAAVKEGRVSDALAEIEALPEVARAEMTDWTARATQRADVLNAIATLSETYN